MPTPLILTLALAPEHQARFDALRERHFPPARNHIPAPHPRFHHLPGEELPLIQSVLDTACAAQPSFPVAVTGLRSLGRGTAFTLDAAPLHALRGALARHFHDRLTPQDRQAWRPHVTIQNKVAPTEAASLLAAMRAAFSPFTIRAEGLLLWHYLGGPWSPASRHPFQPLVS